VLALDGDLVLQMGVYKELPRRKPMPATSGSFATIGWFILKFRLIEHINRIITQIQ
jgi:hypothetical protein